MTCVTRDCFSCHWIASCLDEDFTALDLQHDAGQHTFKLRIFRSLPQHPIYYKITLIGRTVEYEISSDLPNVHKERFCCHNKMGWDWKSLSVKDLAILPAGR